MRYPRGSPDLNYGYVPKFWIGVGGGIGSRSWGPPLCALKIWRIGQQLMELDGSYGHVRPFPSIQLLLAKICQERGTALYMAFLRGIRPNRSGHGHIVDFACPCQFAHPRGTNQNRLGPLMLEPNEPIRLLGAVGIASNPRRGSLHNHPIPHTIRENAIYCRGTWYLTAMKCELLNRNQCKNLPKRVIFTASHRIHM